MDSLNIARVLYQFMRSPYFLLATDCALLSIVVALVAAVMVQLRWGML